MELSFRQFWEFKKPTALDAYWVTLGISPESLPEFIESGPVKIEDEGVTYNQGIWQIIKPVYPSDHYVRVRFYKSNIPNFETGYIKGKNDKFQLYQGLQQNRIHLITLKTFDELFGRALRLAQPAGGM